MDNDTVTLSIEYYDNFSDAFFSYLFLTLLIYPSYIYVYRSNLEQDKETPVFKIVSFFYETNKRVYILIYFIIANYICFLAFHDSELKYLAHLSTVAMIASSLIMYIITQTTHFLLSILALQRFLIYFFSDYEKYLTFTKDSFKWMIWTIYGVQIILSVAEFAEKISNVYLISNLILLSSVCLYLPITVSIRRLNFLPSSKLNSPEKYVLWQLVSIVVIKFSYLTTLMVILKAEGDVVLSCRIVDGFAIPLTVQISYFGSNRRNMKKLISTFKFWNYCRKKTAVVSTDNSINPSSLW